MEIRNKTKNNSIIAVEVQRHVARSELSGGQMSR